MPKTPPRPARPKVVPPDVLLRAACLFSTEPHEIHGVEEADIGVIVTWSGGAQSIYVPEDKPDAAGQTGILCFRPVPGRTFSKDPRVRIYQHRRTVETAADNEPWSVAELDELARRTVYMPAWVRGEDGPTVMYWVEGDPVKARSAWLMISRLNHMTPGHAAQIGRGDCHNYRKLIVDSGWIREDEIHLLDEDPTRAVQFGWKQHLESAC